MVGNLPKASFGPAVSIELDNICNQTFKKEVTSLCPLLQNRTKYLIGVKNSMIAILVYVIVLDQLSSFSSSSCQNILY